MHHPALVQRVHGAELRLAIDAEVEADVGIPLRPAYVQFLFGVADRQQERSAGCGHGDLRVDPERHHHFAAAIVQMAEVREENIVGDRHMVAALGQLMNERAAVGEPLSVQGSEGLWLPGSIHGEPVQDCG